MEAGGLPPALPTASPGGLDGEPHACLPAGSRAEAPNPSSATEAAPPGAEGAPRGRPTARNALWATDFVHDCLADGRPIRSLTIVDLFTREVPAIEVAPSLPGERVRRVLEQLAETEGLPKRILVDNGPEFLGRAMQAWAEKHGVLLDFIEPARPDQNAFVESFNGTFREECLNEHWFVGLRDAIKKIESWRQQYNTARPHSSLGGLTPTEFAAGVA